MQKPVLIIDRDLAIAEALAEQVQNSLTADNVSAYEAAKRHKPQAVIFTDEALYGDLRALLPAALMIAISDEARDAARPGGTGDARAAVDIRLYKPFHIKELLNALRSQPQSHRKFAIGKLVFSTAERKLSGTAEAGDILLNDKEAMVLDYLCRHAQEFVPRSDLLNQVWGYQSDMDTHTLETHIYRLRQKLARAGDPRGDPSEHLLTEEGGYRLDATPLDSAL